MLCAAIMAAGCGTLAQEGGGAAALPNRGIVPYDAPTLVLEAPEGVTLAEPSAVMRAGRIELYVETATVGGRPRIVRAEASGGSDQAFSMTESLLDGGAPSAILVGTDLHLTFERDGGIWHAIDTGDGFEIDPAPLLTPDEVFEQGGIGAPSLVAVGAGFELFYEVRAAVGGPTSIARATAGADLAFTRQGVVLGPGADCADASGADQACWDQDGAESPEARWAATATGGRVMRLFYTGVQGTDRGLGFAAATGGEFVRFPFNPVIDQATASESAATNLALDGGYVLFFARSDDMGAGIVRADNRAGRPSDAF